MCLVCLVSGVHGVHGVHDVPGVPGVHGVPGVPPTITVPQANGDTEGSGRAEVKGKGGKQTRKHKVRTR